MTSLTTPEPQPLPAWLLAERQGWNCVGPGSDWDWLTALELAEWRDELGEQLTTSPAPVLHVVPFSVAVSGQRDPQVERERHAAA